MSYLGNQPTSKPRRYEYTATSSQTVINTPGYSVGNIDVKVNGVDLKSTDYVALDGVTLTFVAALNLNDEVEIVSYGAINPQRFTKIVRSYTASASQTALTTGFTYTPGLDQISVYVNGVRISSPTDYTETDSNTITFASLLNLNDKIIIEANLVNVIGTTDSASTTFTQHISGAVASNVDAKLSEYISAADVGKTGGNTIANLVGLIPSSGKKYYLLYSYHSDYETNGLIAPRILVWNPNRPKSSHDGGRYFSPTVPWNGSKSTLTNYLNGIGETATGTNGCWESEKTNITRTDWYGITNDFDSYLPLQKILNLNYPIVKVGSVSVGNLRVPSSVRKMQFDGYLTPNGNLRSILNVITDISRARTKELCDIEIDGNTYTDIVGITFGSVTNNPVLGAKEAVLYTALNNTAIRNCGDGIVHYATMEHTSNNLVLASNNVGMKLYSDSTNGGANANTWTGLRCNSNKVGLMLCNYANLPVLNNTFIGGTFQENTLCAVYISGHGVGGTVTGIKFDGTHFEANCFGGISSEVIDGFTVNKTVMQLNNYASATISNTSIGDVNIPFAKLSNNSALYIENVDGYGTPSGLVFDVDSTSKVFESGYCIGTGIKYIESYGYFNTPGPSNVVAIGSPIIEIGSYINNGQQANNVIPTIDNVIGVESFGSEPDSVYGAVSFVDFAPTVGNTANNRHYWYGGVGVSGQYAIMSFLVKSNIDAPFKFDYYRDGVLNAPTVNLKAGIWRRIVVATTLNSTTGIQVYVYPTSAAGAKLSFYGYQYNSSNDLGLINNVYSKGWVGVNVAPKLSEFITAATYGKTGGNTIANLVGITPNAESVYYESSSYFNGYANVFVGGGLFVWSSSKAKTTHNGGTIISPTVPWDGAVGNLAAFLAGTGETLPSGNGCWVRVDTSSISTSWFGAIGDGVVNDYPALLKSIASTPIGGTLRINGYVRFATPLVINKRINLFCDSYDDALVPDVGTSNVGLIFQGAGAGLNCIDLKLNVYGKANACKTAVMLSRVDRSPNIDLNIYCGATEYSLQVDGCLINQIKLNSSVNFTPPSSFTSPAFQVDHYLETKNTTYSVATNANKFYFNLEGGRHGIVRADQGGEGNNAYFGTAEGLTGRPNNFNSGAGSPHISDMHLEANALPDIFYNTKGAHIGPNVLNPSNVMQFQNTSGTTIDGYWGGLSLDSNTSGTRIISMQAVDDTSITDKDKGYFRSNEVVGAITSQGGANVMFGGMGSFTLENIFENPFIDIWSNGPSNAPDGATLSGCTVASDTTFYPDAQGLSALVTVTTTTTTDGIKFAPIGNPTARQNEYYSAMLPLFVASGQPDLIVFGLSNGAYQTLGRVTIKDSWFVVRGGVAVASSGAIAFLVRPWNFSIGSGVSGVFRVGGCSIVKGVRSPAHLADSGKRAGYVLPSISYPPAFIGQRAYVSGTGKWYMAKSPTGSVGDWVILN
jgi:hypothetical protein